jgi:hypothetical protein
MLSFNPNYRTTDKVWIYSAAVAFTAEQISVISKISTAFLNQWESHGSPVRGGVEILYNQFVVVIADDCDGHLCGRAQDAQVRLIKELEEVTGCTLLNRMLVGYRNASNEVQVTTLQQFSTLLQSVDEPEKIIVFDNTVTSYGDFLTRWETGVVNTWMNRLLPNAV